MDKQQGPTTSTGNHIQFPTINQNGKEYKRRMCVCVCVCVCIHRERVYREIEVLYIYTYIHDFPHSSVGKESARNAG